MTSAFYTVLLSKHLLSKSGLSWFHIAIWMQQLPVLLHIDISNSIPEEHYIG
jgi:hypothetical protein